MPPPNPIRDFYETHPRMISSPFGGVDGVHEALFLDVLGRLQIEIAGRRVLDIGCGRGFLSEVVSRAGGRYTGADFVVSRAGFPLVQADAAQLPFPDAAFDLVFCIDASEHFPAPERAAAEIARVLRPDGIYVLSAPNYANVAGIVKWCCESAGWYRPNTWAPFGRWTPQELEQPLTPRRIRRLYAAAGLPRARAIGHPAEVGLGLFPWLDHPRTPDALRFRLQRLFAALGPAITRAFPAASLHLFWRIER